MSTKTFVVRSAHGVRLTGSGLRLTAHGSGSGPSDSRLSSACAHDTEPDGSAAVDRPEPSPRRSTSSSSARSARRLRPVGSSRRTTPDRPPARRRSSSSTPTRSPASTPSSSARRASKRDAASAPSSRRRRPRRPRRARSGIARDDAALDGRGRGPRIHAAGRQFTSPADGLTRVRRALSLTRLTHTQEATVATKYFSRSRSVLARRLARQRRSRSLVLGARAGRRWRSAGGDRARRGGWRRPARLGAVAAISPQVARQWERAVVLRLGRYRGLRGPGLFCIVPFVDMVSDVDRSARASPPRSPRSRR